MLPPIFMRKQKIIYNIDWMQVYCVSKSDREDYNVLYGVKLVSSESNRWGYHNEYTLIGAKDVIVGYEWVAAVIYKNYTVATVAAVPRDKKRNGKGCAIKMSNYVLYTRLWYDFLMDISNVLGWEIQNITRMDLAADFNYFWHGLYPETFIRKYLCSRGESYYRRGGNKYNVIGGKKMIKDKTKMDKLLVENSLETLRFGSRVSGVSVYLYNKSKELDEIKDKPHIRAAWQEAGLNEQKVWRLEFSISNQGTKIRDLTNGFINTLFHDDVNTAEAVKQYFHAYAQKYFSFKVIRNGAGAKYKELQDVELFDPGSKVELKPVTISRLKECGKTDKVIYNNLEKAREYIAATDHSEKYEIDKSLQRVQEYYRELYSIKDLATKNERSIKDLAYKFSEDYLRERLRLGFKTRKNKVAVDKLAENNAIAVMEYYEAIKKTIPTD